MSHLQGRPLRDGEEVVQLLEGVPKDSRHVGPLDFSFIAGKNAPADIISGGSIALPSSSAKALKGSCPWKRLQPCTH